MSSFRGQKTLLFPTFQGQHKEFGLSDEFKKHVSRRGLDVVVVAVYISSCTPDDRLCNSHTADTSTEKVVGVSTVRLVSIKVVIRLIFSMAS